VHRFSSSSKECLFHSPPSRPSACLAPVRTSTKGLSFQLAMALCNELNAPRDASCAQPRPRPRGPSGSMGDPLLVGSRTHLHAHWRASVGHRHTRHAYARLCLMGDPSQNAAPAAFRLLRLGTAITSRSLQVFKANATLALHPCQTANTTLSTTSFRATT
jgi:hypothetical protein